MELLESQTNHNNHKLEMRTYFPKFGFYLHHPPTSSWNLPFSYNLDIDEAFTSRLNETQNESRFPFFDIPINPLNPTKSTKKVSYIEPDITSFWLFDRLFPVFHEANQSLFHFDIDNVIGSLQYSIEKKSKVDYPFHQDIGSFGQNNNKLTMIVQLSDPSEYEGGDHQIMINDQDPYHTLSKEKGSISVYPSFLMSRINRVTKGERKTLTLWAGGRAFR